MTKKEFLWINGTLWTESLSFHSKDKEKSLGSEIKKGEHQLYFYL